MEMVRKFPFSKVRQGCNKITSKLFFSLLTLFTLSSTAKHDSIEFEVLSLGIRELTRQLKQRKQTVQTGKKSKEQIASLRQLLLQLRMEEEKEKHDDYIQSSSDEDEESFKGMIKKQYNYRGIVFLFANICMIN